jgi:hypothetical protein
MPYTLAEVREYWLQFVLPTAQVADMELNDFVSQLTPEGRYKCSFILSTQCQTPMLVVLGTDVHTRGVLDNFDAVEKSLCSAFMDPGNCNEGCGPFNSLEDVALKWLNDYMATLYTLAVKYHAEIPCISQYVVCCSAHKAGFHSRFPLVVDWHSARTKRVLSDAFATATFVSRNTDVGDGDGDGDNGGGTGGTGGTGVVVGIHSPAYGLQTMSLLDDAEMHDSNNNNNNNKCAVVVSSPPHSCLSSPTAMAQPCPIAPPRKKRLRVV